MQVLSLDKKCIGSDFRKHLIAHMLCDNLELLVLQSLTRRRSFVLTLTIYRTLLLRVLSSLDHSFSCDVWDRLILFRDGFVLRCFQLLSTTAWLPSIALSDNWYTRGCVAMFLSYSWQLPLNQSTTPTDSIQTGSHRS